MAWNAAGAGAGAAAIGDILKTVIRDADIQTRAPGKGEESGTAVPDTEPRWTLPELPGAAVLVVLVLLGLGGLLLIGWSAVTLLRPRGSRPAVPILASMADPVSATAADAPDPDETDPDETERLARDGDFSAAIHLLLLRALGQLEQARNGTLPRSLTSREILRRAALPGEAGAALAKLVAAVEASHFGGATADEATYRLCSVSYRRLIAAAAP